jgi:hypothetical protein
MLYRQRVYPVHRLPNFFLCPDFTPIAGDGGVFEKRQPSICTNAQ